MSIKTTDTWHEKLPANLTGTLITQEIKIGIWKDNIFKLLRKIIVKTKMVYETRSGFSPVNINNLELKIDFGQWNFKNLKEKQTEDNWRHTEDHPELTDSETENMRVQVGQYNENGEGNIWRNS